MELSVGSMARSKSESVWICTIAADIVTDGVLIFTHLMHAQQTSISASSNFGF